MINVYLLQIASEFGSGRRSAGTRRRHLVGLHVQKGHSNIAWSPRVVAMYRRELVVTALLSLMLAAQARPPTMFTNVHKLSIWCGARAFESDDCTTGEIIEGGSMFGFIKDICVDGTTPARSLKIDPGGRFCRYKAFDLNQCDGRGEVGKGLLACVCIDIQKPLPRRSN